MVMEIISTSDVAGLRKELAELSREVGVDTDHRLIVCNNGEPMSPGARYVATFLYPGYRWTRVSLPGESKGAFYARVLREAGERGGILTVCGGYEPEPRNDSCDPSWSPI
jgi:hypothetical protein